MKRSYSKKKKTRKNIRSVKRIKNRGSRRAQRKDIGFVKTKQTKTKEKPAAVFILSRSDENPILSSRPENGWEAWQTFNPGVILIEDKIHILYRAIGEDGISRLGYAVSRDGFIIDERLSYPVYQHQRPSN